MKNHHRVDYNDAKKRDADKKESKEAKKSSEERAAAGGKFKSPPSVRKATSRQATLHDLEKGSAAAGCGMDDKSMKKWGLDHWRAKYIHDKLISMIVMDNQPFSLVEDQGFIDYTMALNPRYPIPGRTYTTNLLEAKYNKVKLKISEELQNAVSVSFTV